MIQIVALLPMREEEMRLERCDSSPTCVWGGGEPHPHMTQHKATKKETKLL